MENKQVKLRTITRDHDLNDIITTKIVTIPKGLPYYVKTNYSCNMEEEELIIPSLVHVIKEGDTIIPVVDNLTNKYMIRYFDEKNIKYFPRENVDTNNLIMTYAFLTDKLTLYEISKIHTM